MLQNLVKPPAGCQSSEKRCWCSKNGCQPGNAQRKVRWPPWQKEILCQNLFKAIVAVAAVETTTRLNRFRWTDFIEQIPSNRFHWALSFYRANSFLEIPSSGYHCAKSTLSYGFHYAGLIVRILMCGIYHAYPIVRFQLCAFHRV